MNRLTRYSIVFLTNMVLIIVVRMRSAGCPDHGTEEDVVPCHLLRVQSESRLGSNRTAPPSPPLTLPVTTYVGVERNIVIDGHSYKREPVIYLITPTYHRQSQKADLVSLCHTLKHVRSLVWILVENSVSQSPVIRAALGRCGVLTVHLTVDSPERVRSTRKYSPKVTGVLHRNTGLRWVREHCSQEGWDDGVVYFGDDDDRYDLRFFDEIRKTERVSVFMVGLTGGLLMEGPYCENGTVARWHRVWTPERPIAVDMQGFAVNVRVLMEQSSVWMDGAGAYTDMGYLEASRFIYQLAPDISALECRSRSDEVFVWRTRTIQSPLWNEKYEKSDTSIEL